MHPTTEVKFFFVEAREVVARGVLRRVMIGEIRLQDDLAWSLASTGPARDLREKLEGPLGGAEIRETESDVGPDHSDQRDAMDVVSLGNHLRSDQKIEFAFIEGAERALEVFFAADGVAIQPSDAGLREHPMQKFFQLF